MSKLTRDISTGFSVLKRIVVPKVTRVAVHVTYDCNQHCKTCDIWAINKDNPELRKTEVTLKEFERFCEVNPGILWMCLTGGEPYLKKNMKGFLDACCSIPGLKLISISTNGSVPDKIEDDVRHFMKSPRKDITLATQVSFEGPEDLHDQVSGTPGSFRRALDTLERLRSLAQLDSRVRYGVGFTLSYFNQGSFFPTLEALGDACPPLGQVQASFGQKADYYHWKEDREVEPSRESLVSQSRTMLKLINWKDRLDPYSLVECLYHRKALQVYANGTKIPHCVACEYTVTIDPYWEVHPCLFKFGYSLGNLRNCDFRLQELVDATKNTWKPYVDECNKNSKCWTLCEDYIMVVARPWRVL